MYITALQMKKMLIDTVYNSLYKTDKSIYRRLETSLRQKHSFD